jgi:hypothetical protein
LAVDQILRKAQTFARNGDKAAAENLYREVLNRFPGNRKAAAELQALSRPVIENPPEAELDQLGRGIALCGPAARALSVGRDFAQFGRGDPRRHGPA